MTSSWRSALDGLCAGVLLTLLALPLASTAPGQGKTPAPPVKAKAAEAPAEPADQLRFYQILFSGPENFLKAYPPERQAALIDYFKDSPDLKWSKVATANMIFYRDMNGELPAHDEWAWHRDAYAVAYLDLPGGEAIDEDDFYQAVAAKLRPMTRATELDRLRTKAGKEKQAAEGDAAMAKLEQERIDELTRRISQLEAMLGMLLSDPYVQKRYRAQLADGKEAPSITRPKRAEPPPMSDEEMAAVLYRQWQAYLKDPVAFEERMAKEDPEIQAGWKLFKEEYQRELAEEAERKKTKGK